MAETTDPLDKSQLTQIEPGDRLVVLARTIQANDPEAESTLKDSVGNGARFGEACLGQALYRHRSIFHKGAEVPVWSHLELSYFREMVPAKAIHDLMLKPQPTGMDLLRAEVLLTTPASFVLPRGWQGSDDRPELQASMEYIDVEPKYLDEYRNVMRKYCGLAATKLVQTRKFGTFRAMETAAVLYQDPGFNIEWNQIHLCEVNADGFTGFGKAFSNALRDDPPDGADIAVVFADLDRIRTVSRWTFNDAVVEADAALGKSG